MEFTKSAITLDQQIDRLINHCGLGGSRSDIAMRVHDVGYYRLKGYLAPFQQPDGKMKPGTTIEDVWRIYTFDRRLRLLTFDAIERFEVFIRSELANLLSAKYGPFGYQDKSTLPHVAKAMSSPDNALTPDQAYKALIGRFKASYSRATEAFIEAFRKNHGDAHELPPYWMLVEIIDFGTTRQLFVSSDNAVQSAIAQKLGIRKEVLLSWLNALRSVRNTCCHHSRLWNRRLGEMPALPKGDARWDSAVQARNRVYCTLTVLKYLLDRIAPSSNWDERLKSLFIEYETVDLGLLGFPEDWQETDLWRYPCGRKTYETEERLGYYRWIEASSEVCRMGLQSIADDPKELNDAFYRDLAFGTGGLRGVLGAGPNRMNVHTVGKATQGLASYLKERFDDPSVAIARDSRNMGEEFCKVAAGVLAANGVRAWLYPRIEPTPALSFAVRDLGCSAGVNITASHNPEEYNGYKVYGPDGCQITTEAAKAIQAEIDAVDVFDDVRRMDFDEAVEAGLVSWIEDGTIERFLDGCQAASLGDADGELKLVYTPLHGAGLECVSGILSRIGVDDVAVEPEQAVPNGDFPTCPYPNPEERAALERGLALATQVGADLLLATDPDADRVGIAVAKGGSPVLLTGNEVGILLLDYVCEMRVARGEDLRDAVVCTTIVSSAMADALSADRGFELRRTLTGFKFIGEQIGLLEAAGQEARFAFGFEESYGYLAGAAVRDKDAVVASMLICEMARWYRARGMDLVDAMEALYARYGYYRNGLISISYPGAEGAAKMAAITAGLRAESPAEIAGLAVEHVVDYKSGVAMSIVGGRGDAEPQALPSADVLEFQLVGGNKLLVRPSGTEPKIKAYLFAQADAADEADALLARLDSAARELLQ